MSRQISILFFLIAIITSHISGQTTSEPRPKGKLYFGWGYNKDWYSKSDLHFKSTTGDNYDFILHDATAHDLPRFERIFDSDISIPQYIYRIGYTFARHSNMGIEIGFDHAKYIMDRNKVMHVTGQIHGNSIDKDTLVSPEFVRFEHTNGANFLMVSFVYKKGLLQSASGNSVLSYVVKPGLGIVIPQSEVALFNDDKNNVYHIAGYIFGADLSLHYEIYHHFLVETGFKGVYANYIDVLSVANAKANHHFFAVEWLLSIGYQFPI